MTVTDVRDLTQVLSLHPEWLGEVRRLVLTAELLALPDLVRELVEAQKQSEQRLGRLEATMQSLVEQVSALVEAQRRLTDAVGSLEVTMGSLENNLDYLKGWALEGAYREHAAGYFGRWLRRVRVVAPETLEDTLETNLAHDELLEVLRLDLLVSGRLRVRPGQPAVTQSVSKGESKEEAPEVWLAVELAAVVNEADIDRAMRRAALLRRAGYRALPVVAGERLTQDAEVSARVQNVVVMRDGTGSFWDEALTAWVNN